MKLNWKKLLIDLAKVLLGAVTGASIAGCKFALCNIPLH